MSFDFCFVCLFVFVFVCFYVGREGVCSLVFFSLFAFLLVFICFIWCLFCMDILLLYCFMIDCLFDNMLIIMWCLNVLITSTEYKCQNVYSTGDDRSKAVNEIIHIISQFVFACWNWYIVGNEKLIINKNSFQATSNTILPFFKCSDIHEND